jgi:hypothetical protein
MFPLIAIIVLLLNASVQAAETRAISNKPNLSFRGMTAYCSTVCTGEGSSDQIDATLTLYQGSNYIDSWRGSGKGRISVSGSSKVKSGKTYTLTLTYSVNGTEKSSVSTTSTCP